MKYKEIYEEFLHKTKIDVNDVSDYRPCCKMFDVPDIDNAIIVWLKNGGHLIYIKTETINQAISHLDK